MNRTYFYKELNIEVRLTGRVAKRPSTNRRRYSETSDDSLHEITPVDQLTEMWTKFVPIDELLEIVNIEEPE